MLKESQSKDPSNESIIQHFILGIIVFCEALIKILNLIIPKPNTKNKSISKLEKGKTGKTASEIEMYSSLISKRSKEELKKILKDVDVVSSLNKSKLTDLIFSNKEALEFLKVQKKRESLEKMTNQEIKGLLKGSEGISRLRKSELIKMVLIKDKDQKET